MQLNNIVVFRILSSMLRKVSNRDFFRIQSEGQPLRWSRGEEPPIGGVAGPILDPHGCSLSLLIVAHGGG
jgi:hypothetical protein